MIIASTGVGDTLQSSRVQIPWGISAPVSLRLSVQ